MAVTIRRIMQVKDSIEDGARELRYLLEEKEQVLSNAEERAYPNKESIDNLQTQIDLLEDVCDSIDDACDNLSSYE